MTYRFALLDHFQVSLVVIQPTRVGALAGRERARAALVEQELRQIEIGLLAGDAIQLDQRHLGDLVTRPGRALARPERVDEQIGRLDRDIEERSLAGSEMMGDGGLE